MHLAVNMSISNQIIALYENLTQIDKHKLACKTAQLHLNDNGLIIKFTCQKYK